jgi:hypothetical protein
MRKFLPFLIIGLVLAVPFGLVMASGSTQEPTVNDYYYRGGKTIRRQSKQNNRKKTLRYKK